MVPLIWILVLIAAVATVLLLAIYLWISHQANPYILQDTDQLPFRQTALLLGTARQTRRGGRNLYFTHRIAKAAAVYHAHKAGRLLISGADRPARRPDEVDEMEQALKERAFPLRHCCRTTRANAPGFRSNAASRCSLPLIR